MKILNIAAAAFATLLATQADAATYTFSYGFNGTQIASGTIVTDGAGPAFAPGSMNVTSVTGFRNGQAITGFQNAFDVDQGDQLLYPNRPAGYVDDQGLTYQIGAFSYNITSPTANSGGGPNGLYTEYRYLTSDPFGPQQSQFVSSFTLSPAATTVPEPATWGLMILGFGAAGIAMRRRTAASTRIRLA